MIQKSGFDLGVVAAVKSAERVGHGVGFESFLPTGSAAYTILKAHAVDTVTMSLPMIVIRAEIAANIRGEYYQS